MKKILYWTPYIPVVGLVVVCICYAIESDVELCIDEKHHFYWTTYAYYIICVAFLICINL